VADRIQKLLGEYQNVSTSHIVATGDSATVHLIAAALAAAQHAPGGGVVSAANVSVTLPKTVYVQKIGIGVTTDNAAQITFQDTAGVLIAKTKASPGLGPIVFDFGTEGVALTSTAGLDLVISGAGLGAAIAVQAYLKPDVT
jgi:hypothetical protein